jgi:hypothetical protein
VRDEGGNDENSKKAKTTERNTKQMKTTSKISTLIMAIAVTGMLAFGGATTGHAQTLRAFNATVNQITSPSPGVFVGNGTVNIMGPVTVTIVVAQDFSGEPCDPYTAELTFVGATGTITTSDVAGWVCPSATRSGFPFTIQGVWNVTGGTGEFSGITGNGADEGTIAGNGPHIHLTGVVVY